MDRALLNQRFQRESRVYHCKWSKSVLGRLEPFRSIAKNARSVDGKCHNIAKKAILIMTSSKPGSS